MKKLLILSGKGGTGKTTVAAAFIAFAKAEAYADCDVDAPNLHLVIKQTVSPEKTDFYGAKKAAIDPIACSGCGQCLRACRFGSIQIKDKKAEVSALFCEGCGVCKLVCPCGAVTLRDDKAGLLSLFRSDSVFSTATLNTGRGNSGKLVTEVKFALFKAAKDKALAIIDGPPGTGCPVIASVSGADLVLAVAEPSVSGISDLERLIKTAAFLGSRLAVCINKWDVAPVKARELEEYCAENNIGVVGKIPYDRTVSRALNSGVPAAELRSEATDALREVYKNTIAIL